jgi:hypothetical protein
MERGSDKHGARQDDAMSKETLGLTRAGQDTHIEEWRQSEPSGEDQPEVGIAQDGGRGGAPEGMTPKDLDDRAALAALLGQEIWPADAETVQRRVAESLGADRLRDMVARLQKGRVYQGASEVWAALTHEPPEKRF